MTQSISLRLPDGSTLQRKSGRKTRSKSSQPCRPVSTISNLFLTSFAEQGRLRLRDGQRPRKRALPPLGTGRPLQTETGLSEIDRAARRVNGRERPPSDHRTIMTTRTPRVKRKRTTSFREKLSFAAGRHEYECTSRFVHTHTHTRMRTQIRLGWSDLQCQDYTDCCTRINFIVQATVCCVISLQAP